MCLEVCEGALEVVYVGQLEEKSALKRGVLVVVVVVVLEIES